MRFDQGINIWEKGQKPTCVYLIMSGLLCNTTNGRVYQKGQMVGQDEIMFKQDRKYNLRSLTECNTMKIEKDIFEKILKDYPDI